MAPVVLVLLLHHLLQLSMLLIENKEVKNDVSHRYLRLPIFIIDFHNLSEFHKKKPIPANIFTRKKGVKYVQS